jgi:ribose 5-phosphate isomerase RpiB
MLKKKKYQVINFTAKSHEKTKMPQNDSKIMDPVKISF